MCGGILLSQALEAGHWTENGVETPGHLGAVQVRSALVQASPPLAQVKQQLLRLVTVTGNGRKGSCV